jgi:hypothetical protein
MKGLDIDGEDFKDFSKRGIICRKKEPFTLFLKIF